MKELAFVKTVAAAVICGMGATAGFVLSPFEGSRAWLIAATIIVFGLVVAAVPVPRRGRR